MTTSRFLYRCQRSFGYIARHVDYKYFHRRANPYGRHVRFQHYFVAQRVVCGFLQKNRKTYLHRVYAGSYRASDFFLSSAEFLTDSARSGFALFRISRCSFSALKSAADFQWRRSLSWFSSFGYRSDNRFCSILTQANSCFVFPFCISPCSLLRCLWR